MTWLDANRAYVLDMLVQHVRLSVPAIAVSVLVAIVLGRIAWRWPRAGTVVLGTASLLYSVPALPLLIVIPVLLGIPLRSGLTLVVALAVYGTALLASTAADAFRSVDARVREAAEAMGYSRSGLFWKVDLPLAVPVLAVVGLLSFIGTINEYIIASALIQTPSTKTLAVGLQGFISNQYAENWGPFAAGALLAAIPVVILFLFLQKFIVSGLTAGSVKG